MAWEIFANATAASKMQFNSKVTQKYAPRLSCNPWYTIIAHEIWIKVRFVDACGMQI